MNPGPNTGEGGTCAVHVFLLLRPSPHGTGPTNFPVISYTTFSIIPMVYCVLFVEITYEFWIDENHLFESKINKLLYYMMWYTYMYFHSPHWRFSIHILSTTLFVVLHEIILTLNSATVNIGIALKLASHASFEWETHWARALAQMAIKPCLVIWLNRAVTSRTGKHIINRVLRWTPRSIAGSCGIWTLSICGRCKNF